MPINWHEKEVTYESFEGKRTIYATNVRWEENHVVVNHYPDYNQQEFLHEDEVAGIYTNQKEIPIERVYEVNDIRV